MMQVKEIMTSNPACCTPNDPIQRAAKLMIENDCGEIPVVQTLDLCQPIGVITDRDIVCRTVGRGLDPLNMTVSECMSTPLVFVGPEDGLDNCYRLMEENQVRRLPVVGADGSCIGIVALADIALRASKADSGEVLQDVSIATGSASSVI
ncbi:MAG: CBS domain-containing protein [Pyrinomonadaceae bacterium]|nr:CBS domain-containing protein [Pyrinomonadaceae bacterium]